MYNLFKNNGGTAPNFINSLHGGKRGFDKFVWAAKQVTNGVELSLISPDGKVFFVCSSYILSRNLLNVQ